MENLNEIDKSLPGAHPWVPPNDRELTMRARLKTGWSSRSNFIMQTNNENANMSNNNMSSTNANQNANNLSNPANFSNKSSKQFQQPRGSITEAEFQEIEQVMMRAALIEQKEIDRISKLYQRYNSMNRPQGNGETTCLICNTNFGILSSTPRICSDCFKNVCTTCSVDALSSSKQTTIWLCKICAEYRDFLKKSGAWFSKRLPNDIISPSNSNNLIQSSPSKIKVKDTNIIDSNNNTNSFNKSAANKSSDFDDLNSVTNSLISQKQTDHVNMNAKDELVLKPIEKKNNDVKTNKDFKENFFGEITAINKNNSHVVEDSRLNLELDNQFIQDQIAVSRNLNNSATVNSLPNSNSNIATNAYEKRKNSNPNLPSRPLTSSSDSLAKLSINAEETVKKYELGSIKFSVEYIPSLLKLKINLISGNSLAAKDSNGLSDPYVKLHLLPGIAKATKLRSKTVYKSLNPQFNETFYYEGVTNEDLDQKTLRLTVLDEDKFGFDFIGEYRLPLKTILRNEINHFNVPLEVKQEFGDEADTNFRGKINFAIKYSKNTNCLFVKINRCTQLIPMDNGKTSDPFVEISLVPFSKENKQKFKSTIKWKTLDPEFLEEFKFTNIDLKTMLTKTIEISVWDKDFRKNDFIGQVQLGQQRTGEELKHFFTMIKNPELYHEQWHTLHLKDNGDESVE